VILKTRRELAGAVALLGLTALGCNAILGTQPPGPEAGGSGGGGAGGAWTNGAVPCGDDEWTHWNPTSTHALEAVAGADGNSVVVDQLTGLAWQSPAPGSESAVAWSDAGTYCTGLSWGGMTGFRLPTLMELASLTRYDIAPPAMAPILKPGGGPDFWTSSKNNAGPTIAFIISYGNGTIGWRDMAKTASVRCVHDRKPPPDPMCGARYQLVGYGVQDKETGLIWQRMQTIGMVDWSGARSGCAGLQFDNTQWRLPEVAELLTLFDVEANSATGLDPIFGATEPADVYWTNTGDESSFNNAWNVDTSTGATAPTLKSQPYYARCVR
jgi:hypothetical protein